MRADPQADIQQRLKKLLFFFVEDRLKNSGIDKLVDKDNEKQATHLRQLIKETYCSDDNTATFADEVERYAREIEGWLTSTWQILERRHEFETAHVRTIEFVLVIHNNSRVPADNLRFDICVDAGPAAWLFTPADPKTSIEDFPIWPAAKKGSTSVGDFLRRSRNSRQGNPLPFEFMCFTDKKRQSDNSPSYSISNLLDWHREDGVYHGRLKRLWHGTSVLPRPFRVSFGYEASRNVIIRYSLHADHADSAHGHVIITVKES